MNEKEICKKENTPIDALTVDMSFCFVDTYVVNHTAHPLIA